MLKARTSRWWINRRLALLGTFGIGCAIYFLLPRALWLKRKLDAIDEATAKTSIVLDKAAADWRTVDIDGSEHSLADYKGRVVVLDFWYSNCAWCLRSMPQWVELINEFEGKQVAFVGVNSDTELADAHRVTNQFHLEDPILCDHHETTHLSELYRIEMYPTILVLDREGVVRHVHCGYWPTMRSTLSRKIRELLDH